MKACIYYIICRFRNGSALTQARLQTIQNCGTVRHDSREKHERSPSLNLLLRFQRLLIAQIYSYSHKMKSGNSQQGMYTLRSLVYLSFMNRLQVTKFPYVCVCLSSRDLFIFLLKLLRKFAI